MFGYKSTREQLMEQRKENAALKASLAKTSADIEYLAMMTDVEMDEDTDEEETEVEDNE